MSRLSKNVCGIDRAARTVAGAGCITVGILRLFGGGIWGYVIVAVGAALLFTAAAGFCSLYVPFGLSTCEKTDASIEH